MYLSGEIPAYRVGLVPSICLEVGDLKAEEQGPRKAWQAPCPPNKTARNRLMSCLRKTRLPSRHRRRYRRIQAQ